MFFSLLLNPDWSIQISLAPAVCKDRLDFQPFCGSDSENGGKIEPSSAITTRKRMQSTVGNRGKKSN